MRTEDVAYVKYDGVKISNISYRHVLETVTRTISDQRRGYICLTDVSNLIVATKNEQLRAAINESLLSLADGTPLVWYAWMVGCKEIERISGASLMRRLLGDVDGCKHYLLGDTDEIIARVMAEARRINPKIKISGHSPPFKEFDDADNHKIVEEIKNASPDIIWVSFGGGKQERWMKQNLNSIDYGVMIGVGAAFRFIIGDIITPPALFQKMGMQWLFRLVQAFMNNPQHCIKTVQERQILTSKVTYLLNLPGEVKKARKQLKQEVVSSNKT